MRSSVRVKLAQVADVDHVALGLPLRGRALARVRVMADADPREALEHREPVELVAAARPSPPLPVNGRKRPLRQNISRRKSPGLSEPRAPFAFTALPMGASWPIRRRSSPWPVLSNALAPATSRSR